MKDPLVIYVSPSRTNLRFSVKKVAKDKHLSELDWLVNILSRKGNECPKTLIFCNTMNDIAKVVNYLLQKLGDFAYHDTKDQESCYIGIYHSNSWQECKDRITKSLKENGLKSYRCNYFIVHGSELSRHTLYHQLGGSKEHPRHASTSR